MNDNSTGMPEIVGILATVGEASNSRDTRNNRNAGFQQHDRNTGNGRIERQQEYHGLILRQAKNITGHSREANNTSEANNSMDTNMSRNTSSSRNSRNSKDTISS